MQPLFIYLAFQSVHSPLQVPDKYLKRYSHLKNKSRKHFLAMVTAMDEAIGDVIKSLKDQQMLEETLIIFSTGFIFL